MPVPTDPVPGAAAAVGPAPGSVAGSVAGSLVGPETGPLAWFDGWSATDLVQVRDLRADPDVLDAGGWWAVVGEFDGPITGYRFATVRRAPRPRPTVPWQGPEPDSWRSSLDGPAYRAGVRAIQQAIAAGDVYQVNLCRLLSAPLPAGADPLALAQVLAAGNPAPYQGVLRLPDRWVVTASPELFLLRDGDRVTSSPIKGTAAPGRPFADKDVPENVMITDLVRNDLGRVATAGSVEVTALLHREEHPGLAHLVSTVTSTLRPGVGWGELLAATFPPGSVSGAPKSSALRVIDALEPVSRGPYCGAIGYVDADRGRARLAVGIRSFFTTGDLTGPPTGPAPGDPARLHFGTGAGITWGSDPDDEWAETELKAARLIALASGGSRQPGAVRDDALALGRRVEDDGADDGDVCAERPVALDGQRVGRHQ